MASDQIEGLDVAAVFASYPEAERAELFAMRRLVLDTARGIAGVGAIEETLKWGQPSYLTSETGSGSTIRIATTGPKSTHDYAMYFICHTNLVETFEHLFGDVFTYERNRALLFAVGQAVPETELRECVAMALTYHLSDQCSAELEKFRSDDMQAYAKVCGAVLAPAHARSGDPVMIVGYIGSGDVFAEAVTDFGVAYAAQNATDYRAFLERVEGQ